MKIKVNLKSPKWFCRIRFAEFFIGVCLLISGIYAATLHIPYQLPISFSEKPTYILTKAIGPLYILTGAFALVVVLRYETNNELGIISNSLSCAAFFTAFLSLAEARSSLSIPFLLLLSSLALYCVLIRTVRFFLSDMRG